MWYDSKNILGRRILVLTDAYQKKRKPERDRFCPLPGGLPMPQQKPKKIPQTDKTDALVVTYEDRGDQTIVRKSNDLVQLTRNNLTLSQQRLMLHIFAMIKPEDTELPSYELSIYDFIKLSGMNPHSGALYKQVRQNIEDLANAPVQWIRNNGTTTVETFRWIDKVRIDEKKARMTITLDPVLKPYLIQLKSLYTTMDITYTMEMRSTYSVRIYELCKSYQNLYLRKKEAGEPLIWNLQVLYDQLSYTANSWSGFRRFALDKAKSEINGHTDILFDYDVWEKKGQKVLSLKITIEPVGEQKALENIEKINSRVRRTKKKPRTPILSEDSLIDSPDVISISYVSAPETTIPYSYGRDKAALVEEIKVKARLEQLKVSLTKEQYNAVLLMIDLIAAACCTVKEGEKSQDGGNVEVFGRMNAIILDCGGLTSWFEGIAARYAEELIPQAKGKRSPAAYLTRILMNDMDQYRIYIFRGKKNNVPADNIYNAEYEESEHPVDEIIELESGGAAYQTELWEEDPPKQEGSTRGKAAAAVSSPVLSPADAVTKKNLEAVLRSHADEEQLLARLTDGQKDAYQDIIRLTVYFCRRNVKGKDDGMMDGKANTQFMDALNTVLAKYGTFAPLFEALAYKLDYDTFWKDCARNKSLKNPQALFQSIVEKALLYPEMTIRAYREMFSAGKDAQRTLPGDVPSPAGWFGRSWSEAFEEDSDS